MKNVSSYTTRFEMVVALAMVFVAILVRFAPHAPNFSPVLALALFSGAMFTDRRLAYGAPFAMILLSDWALGFYPGVMFVYASYVVSVWMGSQVSSRRLGPLVVAGGLSSAVFFVLSNLGVWLMSGLYPVTGAGLVECFVMALPFLQNTVTSTFVFMGVLFGGYSLCERFVFERAQA